MALDLPAATALDDPDWLRAVLAASDPVDDAGRPSLGVATMTLMRRRSVVALGRRVCAAVRRGGAGAAVRRAVRARLRAASGSARSRTGRSSCTCACRGRCWVCSRAARWRWPAPVPVDAARRAGHAVHARHLDRRVARRGGRDRARLAQVAGVAGDLGRRAGRRRRSSCSSSWAPRTSERPAVVVQPAAGRARRQQRLRRADHADPRA